MQATFKAAQDKLQSNKYIFDLVFSEIAMPGWVSPCVFLAGVWAGNNFACEMDGTAAYLQIPLPTWKTR